MNPAHQPSHEVGVDELFFSTTDARGVIEQANAVFVRLSRFSRDQLVGAPHNIIRHPDMPAGAFRVMWDTLIAGEPFCAYVNNMAADGSAYEVFATITPLGDGYLSVRGRPLAQGLHDAAFSLYQQVRPEELELRDQGWSQYDAAGRGAQRLGEMLAAAGFPTYEEFSWTALPAELAARRTQAAGVPTRPLAGEELGGMLEVARQIHAELRRWDEGVEDLRRVADALLAAAPRFHETIQENEALAGQINATDAEGFFSSAIVYLRVWVQMAPEVSELVTELLVDLDELRRSCAQTRFRIALAELHNQTIGQFIAEIVDGVPGSAEARPAITDLGRALDEGLDAMSAATKRNATLAESTSDRISVLRDLLDLPQTMVREWLSRATRSASAATALVEAVSAQVDRTQADSDLLGSLADECRRIAVPLEVGAIEAQSAKLRELMADAQQPVLSRG